MGIKSISEVFRKIDAGGEVRHLLRNFNFGMIGKGSPPSVLELAKAIGFDVLLCAMRPWERGRLVADSFADNGYRIEVNEADDVLTRRWTVLHEIMHWLLHRRHDPLAFDQYRAGPAHFYDQDELREEREANEAVETIIFGEGALKAALSLYDGDRLKIARHFGVSQRTLELAIAKLG